MDLCCVCIVDIFGKISPLVEVVFYLFSYFLFFFHIIALYEIWPHSFCFLLFCEIGFLNTYKWSFKFLIYGCSAPSSVVLGNCSKIGLFIFWGFLLLFPSLILKFILLKCMQKKGDTVNPWTTWVWTVWVHLYMDIFQ